jgi:uncharacterized protein
MSSADFVFEGELSGLAAGATAGNGVVRQEFELPATVKHWIEALGVPHTEVGAIRVNERPADGAVVVSDGDRIEVRPYPPGCAPRPAEVRFIADVHAHTLARYLRMLGLDTLYGREWDDAILADVSAREERILLTMDVGLLKRRQVRFGSLVRHEPALEQVSRVMARYGLGPLAAPLTRCLACNGRLEDVGREQVLDRVPPRARALHERFRECPECGRVYWEGSHHAGMLRTLDALRRTVVNLTGK